MQDGNWFLKGGAVGPNANENWSRPLTLPQKKAVTTKGKE